MNEREKELKFLEIFGEIDDTLILAAAAPQRETYTHEGKAEAGSDECVTYLYEAFEICGWACGMCCTGSSFGAVLYFP